jgi:hypothetical protein
MDNEKIGTSILCLFVYFKNGRGRTFIVLIGFRRYLPNRDITIFKKIATMIAMNISIKR